MHGKSAPPLVALLLSILTNWWLGKNSGIGSWNWSRNRGISSLADVRLLNDNVKMQLAKNLKKLQKKII